MSIWVTEWVRYLQSSGGLIGIPLALGGLVLMLGGWRIWKAAVVLSFAIIGAAVGAVVAKEGSHTHLYAAIGFLALGAVSFPPVNYSVVVLGGIIGAAIVNHVSAGLGVAPPVLWVVTGIGLLAACALSFLNLRQVVVVITSFEGAVLLLSAAVAFLSEVPGLYEYFRTTAYQGSVIVPFLLLVPTAVGTMCQLAEANRKRAGASGG